MAKHKDCGDPAGFFINPVTLETQEVKKKFKKGAIIVKDENGMNYWRLPNGRMVGSWHGAVPPSGGIHLGKGWWLNMRTGQIYRQKRTGVATFTYSEVNDYFVSRMDTLRDVNKALKVVEQKYGYLQADRIAGELGVEY
jgi:hypothetical protein